MKQSVVELLIEQIKTNTKKIRRAKGAYVDCLIMVKEAKVIEIELLKKVWEASEQNMRSQFSSSAYKGVTFEQWFEQFKNK